MSRRGRRHIPAISRVMFMVRVWCGGRGRYWGRIHVICWVRLMVYMSCRVCRHRTVCGRVHACCSLSASNGRVGHYWWGCGDGCLWRSGGLNRCHPRDRVWCHISHRVRFMVWVGWCSCGFLTMCVMAGDSALVCDTSHLWYVKHVMEAPCIFGSKDTQPVGFGGHWAIRGATKHVQHVR